jgi:Pyruvate/2-oxoacid:ferredoxin oxidoreductase gamma subunit
MTASMVMLGAYGAVTAIVGLDSIDAAIAASLPAYRSQHVALNVRAVHAGFDAAPQAAASAWEEVPA